jgi:hypothetical protein
MPTDTPTELGPTRKDALTPEESALYDQLAAQRRHLAAARAQELGQPVDLWLVAPNAALRALCRWRPCDLDALRHVPGFGPARCSTVGEPFLETLRSACAALGLSMADAERLAAMRAAVPKTAPQLRRRPEAFAAFADGASIAAVAAMTGAGRATVEGWLEAFVREGRLTDGAPWVDEPTIQRVLATAEVLGRMRTKPIFAALDGAVPYAQIRVALAVDANRCERDAEPS